MAKGKKKEVPTMSDVSKLVQTLTIQGIQFEAKAPYTEGHTLTSNEAIALNQVLGENLRNNFASHIKAKAVELGKAAGMEDPTKYVLTQEDVEGLRGVFADYSAAYEFQGKRIARQPVDPVEREARKLATAVVKSALNAKNIDVKGLAEGKLEELVDAVLLKRPDIREEAARRVQATKDAADDVLNGLI